MKVRTVYFNVNNMSSAIIFWQKLLGFKPHKKSEFWSEFKCENINLGLLARGNLAKSASCIPVFEVKDEELETLKQTALKAGATIEVNITDHPDKKSYVLHDPEGNEFEITKFHD